ncbi:MAG TPA: hypothetical protein VHX36_12755 [Candidatus Acidoferrales bacterium]|nr:hypothetical protein [Candidatus Acidoferrales bacterium]
MQTESNDFVHVLLFQCMSCGLPVVNAIATDSKNLEDIDLDFHNIVCSCGWSGEASGLEAKRHWVESWRKSPRPNHQPD